ncbi:MAG: hypothetical protein ACE14P_13835 [Methanotrichaceae archaeon]
MLDEFKRYCSLQRDQKPLAHLLIYMKRRGSWTQLNQIWKDLGPSGGGPFWNQTTLINKLDKLERLGIVAMERRVLPSSRSQVKKKTNTFYRLDPASPIFAHIYSMLKIYKEEPDRYSSELIDRPLDSLFETASKSDHGDTAVERELEVAMELIGEVFNIGSSEVRKMVKERMVGRGMIKETKRDEKSSQKAAKTKKQKIEVPESQ